MEGDEIISEEWSDLSGFYTAQEAEFMTHQTFLQNRSVSEDLYGNYNVGFQSSVFWPTGPSNVSDATNNFASISMFCEVQFSEPAQEDDDKTRNLENSGKRPSSSVEKVSEQVSNHEPCCHFPYQNLSLHTTHLLKDFLIQKNKRNVKPRRNIPKCTKISNGGLHGQNSSSFCSSEDNDSIASQEDDTSSKDNSDLKSNPKSRSDRGSLYARRRRGRINERLRILQNLVPNGTKVDISTMLEEAVQYVKFLQLQIKLLSSDDLWMYAPIVYNGMNIRLDLKITPTKQP